MAWKKPDYGTYRGRRTAADRIHTALLVLLILVLAAGALLLLGQRYLVYRDGQVTLELPFLRREPGEVSLPELGDISVVEQPAASVDEQQPEVWAVTVTVEQLLDGTARELAEQAGADTLIVEMKSPDGQLKWKSQEAIARNVRANSAVQGINETLEQCLAGTPLHTVARVHCFRDGLVGADGGCVLRDSTGSRWDEGAWSTPENNTVRSYLARAAAELAAMGFDEVLLEDCGWPGDEDGGDRVNGSPAADLEQRRRLTEKFLAETAAQLESYDTLLSVRCTPETAQGTDDLTGLTPRLLEQYADRLWIGAAQEDPTGCTLRERQG